MRRSCKAVSTEGSFSLGRHTRVNDILATFGEAPRAFVMQSWLVLLALRLLELSRCCKEETITSRRPSSLPGGLDSLGHGGPLETTLESG